MAAINLRCIGGLPTSRRAGPRVRRRVRREVAGSRRGARLRRARDSRRVALARLRAGAPVNPAAVVAARESEYAALHAALDAVAREKRFLAATSAPAYEQSVTFYRMLAAAAGRTSSPR